MSLTLKRELVESRRRGDDGGLPTSDASWFLGCKAVADAVIAWIILALTALPIVVLMVVVKLTSPGPALFRQVRLGRGGRPFVLYKIRTMADDCERLTGPRWCTTGDDRITAVGRFLRRSHLDELPQLWNVIRGEMSLVGPRPERPEIVADLQVQIAGYEDRLRVLPGITGLAQVQLRPDEDLRDVRRKVACDLCYISQMGPWLELRILLGTAMKVVGFSYKATRHYLDLPGVEEDPGLNSGPEVVGSGDRESDSLAQLQTA